MASVNPNRQRLMAPLDYLAAMAGVPLPPPDPAPMYDAQFSVGPAQPMIPMPFADPPPAMLAPPRPTPALEQMRRSWGY